jgi:hypothetical protein
MQRCFLILIYIYISVAGQAQTADTTLPYYKRFPTITPFQILLSDSVTLFTRAQLPKETATAFIIFSPECSHCQEEAGALFAKKDQLKGIQIVMITMNAFPAMKEFIFRYRLNEVPNLFVGRDIYYLMPAFYQFRNLPFHAMYNRDGHLLSTFEGSMAITQLINVLKEQ